MSESELKFWAEAHAQAGSAVAKAVLCLFEKLNAPIINWDKSYAVNEKGEWFKNGVKVPCPMPPPVLDRAPEIIRPFHPNNPPVFDGSTGTPPHGKAGRKEPTPPGAGQ